MLFVLYRMIPFGKGSIAAELGQWMETLKNAEERCEKIRSKSQAESRPPASSPLGSAPSLPRATKGHKTRHASINMASA